MNAFHSQFFILGSLAILLTVAGGLIPLIHAWKEDHLHSFVSLSAGVLMTTAFLNLLPEAMERTSPHVVGICILISFNLLFILEKFIMLHPCEESHCDYHTMGLAAFFGLITHTFFDGLSLGAALRTNQEGLAWVIFFAIMMHKIPSSFALSSILKKAKWSRSRILLFLFIFGSIIPLGAYASVLLLNFFEDRTVGIALALSLGTFIYISTSDFLPEVHRAHAKRFRNLIAFLMGLVVTAFLGRIFPEH